MAANMYTDADSKTLIGTIVQHVKSEGIFDQLRKECLEEIGSKESYTHLKQRVESHVANFLSKQTWSDKLPKNQVRDSLRKNIRQSDVLQRETQRLIDQVVQINSRTFMSRLQNVVGEFMQKDSGQEQVGGSTPGTGSRSAGRSGTPPVGGRSSSWHSSGGTGTPPPSSSRSVPQVSNRSGTPPVVNEVSFPLEAGRAVTLIGRVGTPPAGVRPLPAEPSRSQTPTLPVETTSISLGSSDKQVEKHTSTGCADDNNLSETKESQLHTQTKDSQPSIHDVEMKVIKEDKTAAMKSKSSSEEMSKETENRKLMENTFRPIPCRRESEESEISLSSIDNDNVVNAETGNDSYKQMTESTSTPEHIVTPQTVLSELEKKESKGQETVKAVDDKSDISDISSVHTSDLSSFEEEAISDISDIEVSDSDSDSDDSSDVPQDKGEGKTETDSKPVRRSARKASQDCVKESADAPSTTQKDNKGQQKTKIVQEKKRKTGRKVGRPKGSTKPKRITEEIVLEQKPNKEDSVFNKDLINQDSDQRRSKRKIKPTRCYSPSNEEEREISVPSKRQRTTSTTLSK